MKNVSIILLGFCLCASWLLSAADVSYDNIKVGYVHSTVDGSEFEPEGLTVGLSKLMTDNVYFTADGDITEAKVDDIKNKVKVVNASLGYRLGLFESVDLYGELGWLSASSSVSGSEVFFENGKTKISDEGYIVEIGARMAFTRIINADIYIQRTGFSDFDNATDIGLTLRAGSDTIELYGQLSKSSNEQKFGLGVQYNF